MNASISLAGRVTSQAPTLDDEQQSLAEVVRDVVRRHQAAPPQTTDSPGVLDEALWQALVKGVGISGLGIAEERGGVGGTYLECHLVLTELGRAVSPSPYLATMLATQTVLAATGDADSSPTIEAVAAGESTATVMSGDVTVTEQPDGVWLLTGSFDLALDGARADVLLVRAQSTTGTELFEVVPVSRTAGTVHATVRTTMDRALHLATITLSEAPARWVGSLTAAQCARLDALGIIAASGIQIGGLRRALEITVDHLKTRTQFGRTLGSFQALKHRVADLLVLAETAESASWGAAAAWAADADDALLLAAVAGSYCGEAYREVAAQCVQLHGGIAITWEHEAHRHLKQAHTMATLFGTPSSHRTHLIDALGLHTPPR